MKIAYGLKQNYPNRFLAFADINCNGAYILDAAPAELEYAIKELGLSGLKIHPNNLNLDAWSGCTWIDISFRILRMFSAERLIFATDYPEREYELYCSVLDQMDFTEEEKAKIAMGNITKILEIASP